MNFEELAQFAIIAAKTAGDVIRDASQKDILVQHKEGGNTYASQVVTAIDRQCDGLIREILHPTCDTYDLGILSEEFPDDGSRFEKAYFWCIDPLDGTLAFINKIPGFSVSIALVSGLGKPMIGVVYNPTIQVLYHAIDGEGVFRNEIPWQPSTPNQNALTYVSDKTLANSPKAEQIQAILNRKMNDLNVSELKKNYGGGAVWNAIRVLEESPACMIKPPKPQKGGGSVWDYAATACIFKEAGCQATGFNGEPLDLNKKGDAFMNHQGVFYFSG